MRPPAPIRRLLLIAPLLLAACAVPPPGGGGSARVDPDAPVKVALMVPTGSTDADREALGRSLVNAARMAAGDLAGVSVEIAVYPTAGRAEVAADAARTAIDEGAQVILGPLFADAARAAAPVAADAGLQVLSLSNTPDIAGGNLWVLGTTFDTVTRRVVGHAAGQGVGELAIVHPDDAQGAEARAATVRAARAAGLPVALEASYPLSVEGITRTAPGIAEDLRAAAPAAVMLTDGPTGGLAFIAETLRGFGVRPGTSRFLGLQRWDTSAQVLSQPSLEGGWFAAPDRAPSGRFERRFEEAYGTAPHPLAGLAYDGVAAIGALVAEAAAEGRNDPFSAERLTQPAGFAGVLGIFRLGPDQVAERGLAIYEVEDGTARQIDPAPRSFERLGS